MNNTLKAIFSVNDALGKLVLRLTLGIFILFHGMAKIFNPGSLEFIKGQLATFDLTPYLAYGVFLGEIVAPLLIILGIFARFGGLLIVGNMLFALFLVHQDELLSLDAQGGWALELQGFFLLCGLTVFLMGSGKFAIKPD
ncbi:putative oxidoreductase [Nitrosomonas cryotolerans]|uniref:Putative oxidoreductase n=1 Tax=Nitrosomonas cryotolerans ATCC 49181 TaxID=1131553 RepID=A0A1N6I2L3_9PROT|nr:DoxX family protein [Nitrosomonas cryotolerans]SFP59020.1 putative oxidoreductase [Nitrosomonas cryotolerans]SIO26274.1 putative oxidoreductase [Nitrosomonas cryotolerans ATCC 49181]